ncbi:adenylate/guanylate cyclase domain-containing protein [Nocardioides bruguierae]|uniref:Adenylate/guanylate cyclase domain-containing protein n=1 Tax=Nocardioides bruguierae TaxID=2945102 RepID=A0A9X2D8I2_9ACTN|nr:adenylate/guanylate cyclase domain-containing protein [Nocardioides bruguierae]MCL8025257.1 adenylate/guanylate cyclase domain-containing protein [Nocardioides bruguierae]MCM0621328.1 adenylate/guanylate cyclase domain-containing protein [Nocardioides bruguierae]
MPRDDEHIPSPLEQAILGDLPVLTSPEVAEWAGVPSDQARRLWRALGFPEYADDVAAFLPSDAEAVRTLGEVTRSGLLSFDLAVNLTRALGQTMARLADWEVSAMVQRVEEIQATDPEHGSRVDAALELVSGFTKPFEELLIYAWRRHLAAAAGRIEALGSEDADLHTVSQTIGFADIVGFTALSNTLTQERIGDLVELFETRCADVVSSQRGRIIKSIGDSVLFVNDDVERAYDTAEGIINVIGRDSRMPDVRVGLATGSVVMRMGDVFGPPVNMAARLTNVARRNRIIVDAETAERLPDDRFETRHLAARPVRGFGIVEPLAVRRR